MPALAVRVERSSPDLRAGLERIRGELDVPTAFPAEVEAAAREAAARATSADRRDARDLPFVTIDPKGSRDLDQAFTATRHGEGYRVHYAIADVAAFVDPAGAVDREARARGVTLYLPDRRAPLHPDALGEGSASLLPGEDRPALLWEIDLGADGEPLEWRLERAVVRSRDALSYRDVQRTVTSGRAPGPLELLRTIGELRTTQEQARGGVSIAVPTQEVRRARHGAVRLTFDVTLASERWNAQISLLAGMCAARTMLDAGTGLLRTLPPPTVEATTGLRRAALALGVPWPDGASYASVVRDLDPADPRQAALLVQAVVTLRGAGYAVVDASNRDDPPVHGAIAAPYAHVTAPLRRLADRFANEIVLVAGAGEAVPGWASEALPLLPDVMADAGRRAATVERAVIDLLEALVLAPHVGEVLPAVIVDVDDRATSVMLRTPPVMARVPGTLGDLGAAVELRLASVDPVRRAVVFETVGG